MRILSTLATLVASILIIPTAFALPLSMTGEPPKELMQSSAPVSTPVSSKSSSSSSVGIPSTSSSSSSRAFVAPVLPSSSSIPTSTMSDKAELAYQTVASLLDGVKIRSASSTKVQMDKAKAVVAIDIRTIADALRPGKTINVKAVDAAFAKAAVNIRALGKAISWNDSLTVSNFKGIGTQVDSLRRTWMRQKVALSAKAKVSSSSKRR